VTDESFHGVSRPTGSVSVLAVECIRSFGWGQAVSPNHTSPRVGSLRRLAFRGKQQEIDWIAIHERFFSITEADTRKTPSTPASTPLPLMRREKDE
jgi:hypothetical protein